LWWMARGAALRDRAPAFSARPLQARHRSTLGQRMQPAFRAATKNLDERSTRLSWRRRVGSAPPAARSRPRWGLRTSWAWAQAGPPRCESAGRLTFLAGQPMRGAIGFLDAAGHFAMRLLGRHAVRGHNAGDRGPDSGRWMMRGDIADHRAKSRAREVASTSGPMGKPITEIR